MLVLVLKLKLMSLSAANRIIGLVARWRCRPFLAAAADFLFVFVSANKSPLELSAD